ncbi:putative O-linked N-acetylglucosamine transferase (SPINDLY family) [Agrobacterium vitis]|nr:putative O-linked N-acetylglucosamine transferase (SPINDLY family) [Agrobacterium vitis]MBE1438748.1 putative O-linked N-acetylglucosamine transferase (SPINDLY family) [Agrobacterium vitis]
MKTPTVFARALQAYQSGHLRECLALLAPLLKNPSVDGNTLLVAAQCHVKLEQKPEAAALYARAADALPQNQTMFLLMAARLLHQVKKSDQALALARRAAATGPYSTEVQNTFRRLLRAQLAFDDIEPSDKILLDGMRSNNPMFFAVDDPYEHLLWCGDEAINSRQTRMAAGSPFTTASRQNRRAASHRFGNKIRVGYLSADYSDQHPTMRLFQSVMLGHDVSRFDIHLFCHTEASVVTADQGLRKTYPNLHVITDMDDKAAQDYIRSFELDILVDLKGHTKDVRTDLINLGLAPLQVAYLGFPGSAYGIDCDYVISDPIVTPDSSKPYYHEKLCRLPECYQANDNLHRPLPPPASRASLGLPNDTFVLASFNVGRKISPDTARLWARVMTVIPDSVLWVMCSGQSRRANFNAFMEKQGIASERIYFADAETYEAHIARLQAADLGLDTYPYNGHTTTSDKLWAGLPVITFKGSNFASRVSQSLLTAIGVPELVADSPDHMVDLAASLAQDRPRLNAIRMKIAENRFTAPLFDTERFTRHLEHAYGLMVERQKAGLEPDHIDVPARPPRQSPFR